MEADGGVGPPPSAAEVVEADKAVDVRALHASCCCRLAVTYTAHAQTHLQDSDEETNEVRFVDNVGSNAAYRVGKKKPGELPYVRAFSDDAACGDVAILQWDEQNGMDE